MAKRILKRQIKGINWTFKMLSDKKFDEIHTDGDYRAITIPDDLEIHFKRSTFGASVVKHELLHAYVHSCLISDNPSVEIDKEEICAKIWEMHLEEAVVLSNDIYKELA